MQTAASIYGQLDQLLDSGNDARSQSGAHTAYVTCFSAQRRQLSQWRSYGTDEYPNRLVVDTNTLLDNPDLSAYISLLGSRYMAHVLPVVLRELDDLKRGGRNPEIREAARRADRRLKGLRTNGGDIRTGVKVAGDVWARFEHVEPRDDGRLPSWLDLTVPDDRLVASALLLQSDHPGAKLTVATGDLNLQTKLAAVRLPFIELPV
ncbi:PIN domain-containing protein [Flexivirga caeni]|uniref:PIN domain-containing protein n=1 Tax=Flexivirga caeni TaxID=2294115 RepID=A0A3M9LXK5_9MICO|nr:PIN domain-containing protein [Flexivirga caeni]RNI17972.1 hypothetical protein EFY87_18915 [Flexivirga caeni]